MIQKSRVSPKTCKDCEGVFKGGPFSYICPKCRAKRLSNYVEQKYGGKASHR